MVDQKSEKVFYSTLSRMSVFKTFLTLFHEADNPQYN